MDGRHPLFVGDGRNIRQIEAETADGVGIQSRSRRQYCPPNKSIGRISFFINKSAASLILATLEVRLEGREGIVGLVNKVG